MLLTLWAGYVFVLPHDEHFAPEVGPVGAYIYFSVLFTIFYVLACAVIAPLSLFSRLQFFSRSPFIAALYGAAAFACVAPLEFLLSGWLEPRDLALIVPLFSISGAVAFYLLAQLSTRALNE